MINDKIHTLTDGTIYLRPYRASDAEALSVITSRDEIYATTYGIRRDFDKEHARWWINFNVNCRRTGSAYEYGIFDCRTDELLGNIGIINVNSSCHHANLAYYVSPDKWGRGIATRAGKILLKEAFDKLRLNRIGAVCMTFNEPSKRVLAHLGFEYEGTARQEIMKDGKYYDVMHFGILREDYINQQSSDKS